MYSTEQGRQHRQQFVIHPPLALHQSNSVRHGQGVDHSLRDKPAPDKPAWRCPPGCTIAPPALRLCRQRRRRPANVVPRPAPLLPDRAKQTWRAAVAANSLHKASRRSQPVQIAGVAVRPAARQCRAPIPARCLKGYSRGLTGQQFAPCRLLRDASRSVVARQAVNDLSGLNRLLLYPITLPIPGVGGQPDAALQIILMKTFPIHSYAQRIELAQSFHQGLPVGLVGAQGGNQNSAPGMASFVKALLHESRQGCSGQLRQRLRCPALEQPQHRRNSDRLAHMSYPVVRGGYVSRIGGGFTRTQFAGQVTDKRYLGKIVADFPGNLRERALQRFH